MLRQRIVRSESMLHAASLRDLRGLSVIFSWKGREGEKILLIDARFVTIYHAPSSSPSPSHPTIGLLVDAQMEFASDFAEELTLVMNPKDETPG